MYDQTLNDIRILAGNQTFFCKFDFTVVSGGRFPILWEQQFKLTVELFESWQLLVEFFGRFSYGYL